jgi:hypothetical protein
MFEHSGTLFVQLIFGRVPKIAKSDFNLLEPEFDI